MPSQSKKKKSPQKPAAKRARKVAKRAPAKKTAPKETQITKKEVPAVPLQNVLLAIRLKGQQGVPYPIELTLSTLRLRRTYNAVLLYDRPESVGMLRVAKDCVTWGKVDPKSLTLLLSKSGVPLDGKTLKERAGVKNVEELSQAILEGKITLKSLRESGIDPVFRLHPPKGGFVRTPKRPFENGGELGDRGSNMTQLLEKML